VLFLLFMLLVVLVIANQMAATDVHDSGAQNRSVEDLFLAESGLETGGYRYRSGTDCTSPAFDLTQPLGSGNFTLTAATYTPAQTTLSAILLAANTVIPVASIAGYAPHGRIRIAAEEINYAGVSSVAANCAPFAQPCFTGATRGAVGSPTPATHPIGTTVNQNQCLIRSVGTTNNVRRTLEAATTIKRVQSGTVVMNPAVVQAVALTAVDPARSFVLCYNRTDDGDPDQRVTCELTNATTLTITSSSARPANVAQWYVVEFTSGVAVQRGLATIPQNQPNPAPFILNVALPTAVDLTKSFVLINERMATGSEDRDERRAIRARLSAANNLELSRTEEGTADILVSWQVIEIEDATVQAGLTTIAATTFSNTAAIAAVDLTRTFVVFTRRTASDTAGREERYQVRGELTNATTLTFTRAGNNGSAVEIAWFAVTLNDGTTVQRGTTTLAGGAGVTTANAPLATAIVINRSFPIISVSGSTDGSDSNARLDDTSLTGTFTSTTNLQFQRVTTTAPATAAWFVVNLGSPRIDWKEIIP